MMKISYVEMLSFFLSFYRADDDEVLGVVLCYLTLEERGFLSIFIEGVEF